MSSSQTLSPPRQPSSTSRVEDRWFPTQRVVVALMIREMTTTYGRSPGGYIWAVLEPVAGIALMSAIFSIGFRSPALGTNFPIYFATGLVPFMAFMKISMNLAQSLNFSRQLLVYPVVTFVDALVGRLILAALTQILVGYIILGGLLLTFDTSNLLHVPAILSASAMTLVFAIGVGTLNCFLITRFPVWQQVWSVITRPLVLVSGVIFLYDNVPSPYREWTWWNPLVHIVGEMRSGFFPSYDAPYVAPLYVYGIGLVLTALGMILLRRYHRELLLL